MHGGEVAAGAVSGLVAPQAPEAERWETLWHYMQSGPGVFKGDLYFYGIDGDVRGELDRIDTAICPLYLLTGEYDYSCSPEDTLAVARAVPGAKVTIMKELGHFPMSENPDLFLSYLEPVLAEIARARIHLMSLRAKRTQFRRCRDPSHQDPSSQVGPAPRQMAVKQEHES